MLQSFAPFNGKYVLGKVLGKGAFGTVYKLREYNTTNEYAVKVILKNTFYKIIQRSYKEITSTQCNKNEYTGRP